ncbi:MAG: hypothetical protein ACQEXJ_09225 [Myxococcota bacterium]
MSPFDPTVLRKTLERFGYRIAIRRDGWTECLVSRDAERWVGHGVDLDEALQDAVRAMFPSALGRELLARAVEDTVRTTGRVREEPAPRSRPEARSPSVPTPAPRPEPPPVPTEEPPAARAQTEAEGTSATERAGEPTDEEEAREEVPEEAPAAIPPGPPVGEALEELSLLRRRVDDARGELAMMAPELQRLHILAWICRARAIQERHPHDMAVERAAGDIARTLGALGKIWWPGSVKALQLRATPLDAGAELGLEGGGRLHDWLEAAEKAEAVLADKLDETDTGTVDEYGWSDRGALNPAPNRPDDLLREVRGGLARQHGPLSRAPRKEARDRLRRALPADVKQLADWARKLRWLRGHTDDFETWGAAMGRLRWAAYHLPRDQGAEVRDLLDPAWCPPQPWSATLGQNPRKKRNRKRRGELLQSLPVGNGSQPEPEDLAEWLGEAFDLGTELPNPRISGLVYPVRDAVLQLDSGLLPEDSRRTRKRLADLKKRLQVMGASEADAIRRDARRELEREPDTPEPEPEPQPEPDNVPDPMERMTREVRRHTRGKKALFVSNREDPALKERIEEMLGLDLTWTVIDPRRVQSKCDSIEQGSFDFVLSATGFQGHNVDAVLYKAAKNADTHYVRVNRGRPHMCVRSLARELGLRHPSRV